MIVIQVRQLLTSAFVKIPPESTARETMELFLRKRQDIGCVIQNGRLLGIVTKYSLYRLLLKNDSLDTSIKRAVKTNIVTLQENESVYHAKDILIEKNVGHAVVLNANHQVVGVMAKSDLIRGLITTTDNLTNRLQSLVDNLQESVISVDSKLNITAINASAKRLFQLDNRDVLEKSSEKYFPTLSSDLKEAVQKGRRTEVKKVHLKSTTVISSFIPIKEWGRITGAMAVLKDVTDYEKVARELETTKRIEKVLDSALDVAYDGVIITDNNGNITKGNHGFMELYGMHSFSQISNQPIQKIAPEIQKQQNPSYKEGIEAELIQIKQHKAIVSQTPILQNNKKIGSIYKIIYQQLHLWKDLFRHVEKLEGEITYYRGELSKKHDPFAPIISRNKKVDQLKAEALVVSQSPSSLLITGESGTGKELLANGVHLASKRQGAFIKINCAAIPESLLESEFFGYVDGAFTGARKGGRPGKFEMADQGTLFLDEIGDMAFPLQAKLLRAVQEKEIERIGDTKTRKIDVRIITATNKNLVQLIQEGKFREDLYYRIHVIKLDIPPLRERLDDIPTLTAHFMKKLKTKLDKQELAGITPQAMEKLQSYGWPGNVRQLESVLERACLYSRTKWIDSDHIFLDTKAVVTTQSNTPSLNETRRYVSVKKNRQNRIEETDKNTILEALEQTKGNRTKAANKLGISRSTLYQKLKKYKIQEKSEFSFD
jgi:transcriptional regulator with PAS, ATPase and Fis domain